MKTLKQQARLQALEKSKELLYTFDGGNITIDMNLIMIIDELAEINCSLLDKAYTEGKKEVVNEILTACQEDVDFGAKHQQIVSTKGLSKCLVLLRELA